MILVTGATGLIGTRLVRCLVAGGEKVRAVTRDPANAGLPGEVEIVSAAEIESALDGVRSVFLNPRAVGTAAPRLLELARKHGVCTVVALAATNVDDEEDRQPSRYRGDFNREVEAAAIDSGLAWVSLRPSMFATNAIGLWAREIRGGDVVRMPYPDAAWAPLTEDDLAQAAAVALRTDLFAGRKLELTGPQSLTQAEMIDVIATVLGRELRVERVAPESVESAMAGAGFPIDFVRALLRLQAEYSTRPAPVRGELAEVLGRPAQTFAAWVADNAAAFGGEAR